MYGYKQKEWIPIMSTKLRGQLNLCHCKCFASFIRPLLKSKVPDLLCRSPQTNHLPPEASGTKPDDDVNNGDDKSIAPPLSQGDIPGAVEDRG